MLDTVDAALARVAAAQGDEIGVGPEASSLEVMQAIYRNLAQPTSRRMRAAMAALPFEHPKLAVAVTLDGFADQIEAAMRACAL
jgi:hypothetical protein